MIKVKNSQLDSQTLEVINKFIDNEIKASAAFKLSRIIKDLSSIIEDKIKHEQKILEKFRIGMIDEIIADTKVEYPPFFLTTELNIMIEELKNDLAQMHIPFDMYLSEIKKTEEQLKEERKEIAEKRVKTQLILSKISVLEDMKPDEALVSSQVADILKMHPTAEKENVRAFVERFEMNQLVWKFLEGVK